MLAEEVRKLTDETKKARLLIETHDQDFYNVKETVPETIDTTSRIHTLEDFTLAFLGLAYVVAVVMLLFLYVMMAPNRGTALVQGLIMSCLITLLFIMLLYYFA